MTPAEAAILLVYYLALGILAIYSIHRLHLVRLRRRFGAHATRALPHTPERWPSVTVQLPLYNEPNVAARLIDAVAALEYDGAVDVQVLDDSTDETTSIVAERVAHWRLRGVRIAHVRRTSRDGFKAGALAHGMTLSTADLFAIFDADFVPPTAMLRDVVPYFGSRLTVDGSHGTAQPCHVNREPSTVDREAVHPEAIAGSHGTAQPCHVNRQPSTVNRNIGMVQARWGHLNRTQSLLTRVQAIYLDAHFAVESAARHLGGRFFNFNGTAGVWRREAIEAAGGWSSSTLTEDLDLSYRAQLAGWDFVFLPQVEVPAELPSALSGFQEQQHRWAKGSIQTARKILPRVWRSDVPLAVKTEATFHLTNNCAYLLTVLVALLMVPAIVIRQRLGIVWTLLADAALFATSTGSVLLFYIEGQRLAGRPRPTLRELLCVLPVGIGISLRNSAAVLEGLVEKGGYFRRTPKRGDAASARVERLPRIPVAELLLAGFFAAALAGFVIARQWVSAPFLLLFLSGFGHVSWWAVCERLGFGSEA